MKEEVRLWSDPKTWAEYPTTLDLVIPIYYNGKMVAFLRQKDESISNRA